MNNPLRVGFIGLGTMGTPMALNVLQAGCSLTVWNRTQAKTEPLARAGAAVAPTIAALVRQSELVITMVATPQDVEAVIAGPGGVAESLRAGQIVIDMSTIDPATSRRMAQAVRAQGGDFLDAPVSGSKQPAEERTLVIMVGGRRESYERALAVFQAMGKPIHAGEVGSGAAMKLVVNMILAHMMAALSEGAVLAQKLALDVPQMLDVIATGGLQSPWYGRKAQKILQGDFSVNFALKHMHKDVRLVLGLGREARVPLPVTETVESLFRQAAASSKNELDYSSVITVLESQAGVQVRVRR
ncbi:MAG: NAD(P)-dependent oxidoreductase [Candidatus Omnitrophica bacterium]|nr:NAD(P)-dependent oxidoreductase [Candidatus Omnitrophota bacterium]